MFRLLSIVSAEEVDVSQRPPPPENTPDVPVESLPPPPESELEAPLPTRNRTPRITSPEQAASAVAQTPRRFHYTVKLKVLGAYDDNITLSQTNRVTDYFTRIEPTISLGFGEIATREENYLLLEYSPRFSFFADHSNFDAFEQVARLEGQYRFHRLTLNVSQDFQSVESSNVDFATSGGTIITKSNLDIGGRRRLVVFTTNLRGAHDFTGKTSLTAGLAHTITDYSSSLINSEVFAADFGFNYIYSPKLTVGIDLTGGMNLVDAPSPNETFEHVHVRLSYGLAGKLTTNVAAGVEFRQFEGERAENVSPVFEIGILYESFDGTTLELNATSQTLNSATMSNQDFTSTQIIVTLRQRFFPRIFAALSAGYQDQSYFSTLNGSSTTRHDKYYFIAPGFDVMITRFWFAGIYYIFRVNDSSLDNFSFDDNQIGVRTSLIF